MQNFDEIHFAHNARNAIALAHNTLAPDFIVLNSFVRYCENSVHRITLRLQFLPCRFFTYSPIKLHLLQLLNFGHQQC